MDRGIKLLEQENYNVDYIITHTAPRTILNTWLFLIKGNIDKTSSYLDKLLENNIKYKQWFFGHLHIDKKMDNIYCLYTEIKKLK